MHVIDLGFLLVIDSSLGFYWDFIGFGFSREFFKKLFVC